MFGMGNRCGDGRYVLFLDYDGTPVEWVIDEISLLHEFFPGLLGSAYLFRTKHGLHVVFLEKHSIGCIVDLMGVTSCDQRYKGVPLQYARRVWVLRQSPKKGEKLSYLGVVPSPRPSAQTRSTAHKLYLQGTFGIKEQDFKNGGRWDEEKDIILGYYKVNDT